MRSTGRETDRTEQTATVEQREGGQETPGYAHRSFATRSKYATTAKSDN